MKPKTLRPYQARLVTDVCRATGDVLIEQPTGSGKTMQIVTLVAMQMGQRFTHAIISAPQEQIERGFVHRDYQQVAWSPHAGVAVPAVAVPDSLILASRKSDLGSVKQIRSYLRIPGPLEHALACTHAALNRLSADDLPKDLSGKALFLDEAHHASADGLAQIVSVWRERGGLILFFTATPYRGDGRPVKLEGMRTFRRSLAEHMAEGFAPRHLDSEIVALGQPGDTITAGQFTGEEAPPTSYFEGLIAAICKRWLEDGKPKAIVRVPPMQGGKSGELVGRLLQALSSHGARVLDATGTGTTDKQRFLTALDAEKNRTHATSTFDVMVGIQRVLEGTDWPVCSAVYCVGMPGSLNTVVQFLGRAMRLKGEDYPAEQRDRAKLVFFVPCGGGAALADLSLDHSRHALLTCCFLADHEVGQEWIVLREVRRGIESALGSRAENPAAADAENEAAEPLDPELRAEVEFVMANAREQILGEGGEATVAEVVQLAAKSRPDLPVAAIHRVAAEVLASQPGTSGDEARETIHQVIGRKLRINPLVKEAMEEAFAVVLEDFRGATLKDSAVLESVGRQVHGVTGGQMREFAKRLRDAAPRPLTEELILAWADAHHEHTGQWPSSDTGQVLEESGETWLAINHCLSRGTRGLAGESSLAQLLAEHRGVRNIQNLPTLSEEQILEWADAFKKSGGRWPTVLTGTIVDAPGETWQNINMALTIGRRGLPGNSSLAKLLEEERGVRNLRNLPWLTVAQILEWADLHKNRTGEWPNVSSGRVLGTDDTWAGINLSLWAGRRGLPGGTSMAILLAEHRGVRNLSDLPPLTEELILAWADVHRERTGEWPNIQSGAIDDASGEKWANVNAALQTGGRGLPGNSSLAKLMQERRGVRNVGNLPSLSEAQILEWADTHKNRTADWPTKMSGPIADAPGETWANVNVALSQGGRDLPGGWTLAKFLEERRGVPHIFNRPLTEEQILVWADSHKGRTGKWPTVKSGPIFEVPGQTWLGIYHALRKGARNLPGGSSLAKLLDERRGVRNKQDLTPLTEEQILQWLDSHKLRTGRWPTKQSGPISDAPGETWANLNAALLQGLRTLPGGSSLARLLAENRNARNTHTITQLTVDQILNWADEHHRRTGTWPKAASGIIPEVPGESWSNINAALVQGRRNLPGDSSLAQLLAENRSVRNHLDLPAVDEDQILAWADAHHERTGKWPKVNSGPIHDVPGEKWANIDQSLAKGLRGLSEGSSLAKLLDQSRAVRNRSGLGPLTLEQILRWADLHRQRTGLWPNYLSGSIVDAAGETWSAIQHLLQRGSRGLPGGSSLARLLKEHRSDTTT